MSEDKKKDKSAEEKPEDIYEKYRDGRLKDPEPFNRALARINATKRSKPKVS